MADVTRWPAHRLAAALRRGEVSSREALEQYLARVESANLGLNAVVTLDVDGARRAADAADAARARGELTGALHGVPMTVKDTFCTAGLRTTCGDPEWDHVPERDAEAVRRLRGAGAVIFGKTNTARRAADWQTVNPLFGATNHPRDRARSPGGSSGGAAAALAAGMTALELGSDVAGSIRLPAGWCGVCGHKPSWGIVPQRGHLPPPPGTLGRRDLNVVGPMARAVADLDLALGVLAGPAQPDAVGWRLELPPPRAAAPAEFRLAAWLDDPQYPVEPEVRAVTEAAITALMRAGVRIVDRHPDLPLAEAVGLHQILLYPLMDPDADLTVRQWLAADERRQRVRARLDAFFAEVDALLTPVAVTAAIRHDHSEPFSERMLPSARGDRPYLDLFGWLSLASVAYLPATVVPVGQTPDGLPVGLQIIGNYLHDRTTLAVARAVEEVLGTGS
ncbi:amidase family protein [Mycolicibacterium hassiacum DSM 44199]|jgi:amidase|uniref:Amidase family protein n=2 Tax=Mycolicibacterium hassiacum TaxID=46351 RepID=K5BF84_MYCHD|nr:amidase family protein [Mycolicibacterium hassiacum]EKF22931.1 amidase family protein [Mycolicibacterium hassiacum DSM 44199]MDA4087311.1 amidase [Mycolicibacterium hassiacum DSM 44199]PZN24298.1 MAG: amidase [Mycolicibacterium hassiacum]